MNGTVVMVVDEVDDEPVATRDEVVVVRWEASREVVVLKALGEFEQAAASSAAATSTTRRVKCPEALFSPAPSAAEAGT
jgi:hypothetical protein